MLVRSLGGALVVGVGLLACTTTQPPAAKPEPVSVASATSSAAKPGSPAPAKIDTSSWAKDWPKTWSDPRVIDALAQRCDFVPDEPPPPHGGFDTPPNMFRCTIGHNQSCNPDYCFNVGEGCEHDCTKTCLDCGGACAKTCESCKARCKDASCTHQCAETCATCKQSCEGALDHCTSAECGKKHAACQKKVQASWRSGGCKAKCTRFQGCTTACDKAKDPDDCRTKCEAQLSPGWKACTDKCDALRDANKEDEAGNCLGDCYQTVPCSPFICQMGGVPEPEPSYGPIKPKP